MTKEILISTTLFFCINCIYAQQDKKNYQEIGFYYFGELGLHPGVEIDYRINIWENTKTKEKRSLSHQINFRPSIAYYRLTKYTNNFLFTPNFNYQLKLKNNKTQRYLFIEPSLKFGYLRYSYIGEIYETSNTGFEERNFGGGNSFIYGGGLNIGGSIKPNKLDWILACEYLAEVSEDVIVISHINFKIGVRLKINK